MAETAADVLLDAMHDWGVDVCLRAAGGWNPTESLKGCASARTEIRFVQVRHEESAALMACAYAK
jgi:pyruvate dehydrogenase (quinone)/pyruvate oxidase